MDLHFENPIVQAEGWRGQEGLAFLFSSGRTSSPLDFDIEAFFFETFKHAVTSLLVSADPEDVMALGLASIARRSAA
jgi:hypothetical protein